ncbi:MAG: hypothetical protein IJQ99_07865 [Synergistaceae bacterium]|nr:hypothetical protein [Synergistaceae bacterium]
MLALQGYYENGKLNLPENAPTKGKVYVIFTEENNSDLQIFDKFNNDELAMKKIKYLTEKNVAWNSEEEMINDMADFRRKRLS